MPERIATELKPLVKLAKEQGWTVSGSDNGKLVWRGPNGEGPVYTGYRCQGRDLMNFRAELLRNGLKLDERNAKELANDEQMYKALDDSTDVDIDKVMEALSFLGSTVAGICAKAQATDDATKAVGEWREIAEDAVNDARKAKEGAQQNQTILDAIRQCFNLQPWAILPEIARLLGIDAANPLNPTALDDPRRTA